MQRHLFLVVEVSDGRSGPDFERIGKVLRLASEHSEKCRFIWSGLDGVGNPVRTLKRILSLQSRVYSKDVDRYANSVQVSEPGNFTKKLISFCSDGGISLNLLYPYQPNWAPSGVDELLPLAADSKSGFSVTYPVSEENVDSLIVAFTFFADMDVSVSFPPIYPGRENDRGFGPPDMDAYVSEMKSVFDAWAYETMDGFASTTPTTMSVQPFASYLAYLSGTRDPSDCAHNSCLMGWLSVRADGSVFPCAKNSDEKFLLDHLDSIDSLDEVFDTDEYQEVLRMSVERRNVCSGCDVYPWCNGGCSMDAYDSGSMSENGGFSCVADRELFLHTSRFFEDAFSKKTDPRNFPQAIADALLKRAIIPKAPNVGNVVLPE